jgi:metallo-beta-lactamase class B
MILRSVFLIAVFLSVLNSCPAQSDAASRAMNEPVKPYRVIGNIYYVGASDVTSFLITTPNGHILLDSGFIETVPQIKQNVAQLGFRLEDIKILLNSHAHYDHAGGFAELKRLTGAKLMTSERDVALLAAGGKGDPNFGDRFLFEPVKPDRTLHDGDKVELGGVTMIARMTPGHTKGCTSWTMKVKEDGKEYDVVFVGSTSAPGYKLVNNPGYPEIVGDYERTFRLLKSLKCDVFLAAHGQFYGMLGKAQLVERGHTKNPFIDPAGYRGYLEDSEKSFRKLLASQSLAQAQSPPSSP